MIKSTPVFIGLALFCGALAAQDATAVSFFASNNVGTVTPHQAYKRLLSEEQSQLQNAMIGIMQAHHLEQSQGETILGMYKMESDNSLSSENSQVFTTSPYQKIAEDDVFSISKQMIQALRQEAVAVFIPNEQAGAGDTLVYLNSHHYNLGETLKRINETLPADYSQSFTLHFDSTYGGFDKARVGSIEWLGSQVDPAVLQAAFPEDKITVKHGQSYLVFKDGRVVNF